MSGPWALGLDSGGAEVSLALVGGGPELHWSGAGGRGADSALLPALQELYAEARRRGGPGRLALSVGPGAFTGLRVGVASGLGLAHAVGLPLHPASSLLARATAAGSGRHLALMDARLGRVYAGLYENGQLIGQEGDLLPEELPAEAALAVGEGCPAARGALQSRHIPEAAMEPAAPALALARLALQGALPACPLAEVALRYLREPALQVPADMARR